MGGRSLHSLNPLRRSSQAQVRPLEVFLLVALPWRMGPHVSYSFKLSKSLLQQPELHFRCSLVKNTLQVDMILQRRPSKPMQTDDA